MIGSMIAAHGTVGLAATSATGVTIAGVSTLTLVLIVVGLIAGAGVLTLIAVASGGGGAVVSVWMLAVVALIPALLAANYSTADSNVSKVESHYKVSDISFTGARPGTPVPVIIGLRTPMMTSAGGWDGGRLALVAGGDSSFVNVSFSGTSGRSRNGYLSRNGNRAVLYVVNGKTADGRNNAVEYSATADSRGDYDKPTARKRTKTDAKAKSSDDADQSSKSKDDAIAGSDAGSGSDSTGGFTCPDGWTCKKNPTPKKVDCPKGWTCKPSTPSDAQPDGLDSSSSSSSSVGNGD